MIITAPTKQQRKNDEIVTGFKNIYMLRLTNIQNDWTDIAALDKYIAVNCIVNQEIFLDHCLVLDRDHLVCELEWEDYTLNDASQKVILSVTLRRQPQWCNFLRKVGIFEGRCGCRHSKNAPYSHMGLVDLFAKEGAYPYHMIDSYFDIELATKNAKLCFGHAASPSMIKRQIKKRKEIADKVNASIRKSGLTLLRNPVINEQTVQQTQQSIEFLEAEKPSKHKIIHTMPRDSLCVIPLVGFRAEHYCIYMAPQSMSHLCERLDGVARDTGDILRNDGQKTEVNHNRKRRVIIFHREAFICFDDGVINIDPQF